MLDVARHRNRRPLAWQAEGVPLLWWRTVLVSLLLRPRRPVVDSAVALAASAGWILGAHFDDPDADADAVAVVGVHVRRGDKVVEVAPPKWKDYATAAERCAVRLAEAAEARGRRLDSVLVYVSSDSPTAGGEARWQASRGWAVETHGRNLTLEVAVAGEEGLVDGVANDDVLRSHQLDVTEYARQAIRAAWVLSETDCLVTTFSSNMGRLAYELMLGKRGEGARVASLDTLWYTQP